MLTAVGETADSASPIRFLLSCAQELAAAFESLLADTFRDVDPIVAEIIEAFA